MSASLCAREGQPCPDVPARMVDHSDKLNPSGIHGNNDDEIQRPSSRACAKELRHQRSRREEVRLANVIRGRVQGPGGGWSDHCVCAVSLNKS